MAGRTDLRTIFERRAETVLRQASQLATLCATPACVVIYNPNASRPWRMWPESEAEVRSVVELYRSRAESGCFGGGGDDGLREMTEEEAKGALVDVDGRIGEVQARIDMIMSQDRNINNHSNAMVAPPQPVEERAMVVAGAAEWMNRENNNVVCQNDDDHEDEEAFDITEYLNFSALEGVDDGGGGDDLDRALIDDEAGVRSVVELYRSRAESSWFGGGGDDGPREMTEEEAMGALVDVEGEVPARIDMIISRDRNINNHSNMMVASPHPVEEWAMVAAGAAEWMNGENYNVVCQNDDDHEEEEAFDITEYLNFSALESVDDGGGDDLDRVLIDDSGHCYFENVSGNVVAPNDATQYDHQFVPKAGNNNKKAELLLYEQGISSASSVPRRVAGNKRKVPEKVASFSELVSPSPQLGWKPRSS